MHPGRWPAARQSSRHREPRCCGRRERTPGPRIRGPRGGGTSGRGCVRAAPRRLHARGAAVRYPCTVLSMILSVCVCTPVDGAASCACSARMEGAGQWSSRRASSRYRTTPLSSAKGAGRLVSSAGTIQVCVAMRWPSATATVRGHAFGAPACAASQSMMCLERTASRNSLVVRTSAGRTPSTSCLARSRSSASPMSSLRSVSAGAATGCASAAGWAAAGVLGVTAALLERTRSSRWSRSTTFASRSPASLMTSVGPVTTIVPSASCVGGRAFRRARWRPLLVGWRPVDA